MPTLKRNVRAKLRIESLEDRCVWSVGFAPTLTLPTLPSTTLQGDLVSANRLSDNWLSAPIPDTSTSFTWNDGIETTGTVHVTDHGVLTIQTTRSIDPTQDYTITFTLPATSTTDPLTFVVKVTHRTAPTGDATPLAPPTPRIDPVDLFGSSLMGNLTSNEPAPVEPRLLENITIDVEVLAPPMPFSPNTPAEPATNTTPANKEPANVQPPPAVPVIVTIRVEPPLNRPGAQSQFIAGSVPLAPVDNRTMLPTNWQPPPVNPLMLASTAHTVPIAPMPPLTPTIELLGVPAEHIPQTALKAPEVVPIPTGTTRPTDVVSVPERDDRVTLTGALAPVRIELPTPIVESNTTPDAILARFASEVIIREPSVKPEEKSFRTSPLLRWLSLAVLTTVIGRTWLKPPPNPSDESKPPPA